MKNKNTEKKWYAVYTFHRREKSAMKHLISLGIEAYVPVLKKTKRYNRKIKHYEIPIISHYVFVNINREEFIKVLQVRDVIRFLKIGRELSSISQHEMDTLKKVTGELDEINLRTFDPNEIGRKVEIIGGALTGMKGKVLEDMGQNHLLVDFQNIGYSLCIQVPSVHLRAVV